MMYNCPDKLMAYAEQSNESDRQYLQPHEFIGDRAGWLYSNLFMFVVAILILTFIVNHVFYIRKNHKRL
jgi:hypothetical protein